MNWDKKFTAWIGSRSSVLVHTVFFVAIFSLPFFGVHTDKVLLVLTTIVSLEAIYLAIFIQMTVNRNTESLEDVEEDLEEIQEDVGEISEDIEEIQADVDELQEDDNNIVDSKKDVAKVDLDKIQETLNKLLIEIEKIKSKNEKF